MAFRFLVLALGQVLVAVVTAATVWAAGAIVGGLLRRQQAAGPPAAGPQAAGPQAAGPREASWSWAFTMAIGFAALAQVLLVAGMVGLLRAPVVLAIVVGVHVVAIAAWRSVVAGLAAWLARVGGLVVLAAGATFLLTLYPPLGFDQTMYHLPYARAFAASGGVPFLPALRFPIFPQLSEVLNAAVLMFAGDVATQAVGWVALMACVGLAYSWACELGGEGARAGGWLAASVIVGSPIALYLAASGYVEPMLALLGGGSLYAAERARRAGDVWWLVAAGALAGSAAGVKYHGLYFVPAVGLLMLRRGPWREGLRDFGVFGLAAGAALLPSYGRLIAQTGNPVFPFYPEIFGANPWADGAVMGPSGAARWQLVLTRLWDVTFRRQLVGGLPAYSPAFVGGLPIIIFGVWRDKRLGRLLLVAIGYLLVAPTHAHHLFAIAVLWSVLVGVSTGALVAWLGTAFGKWFEGRMAVPAMRSGVLIAAAMVIASGGQAYAAYRLHRLGLPPVTSEGRDRLLAMERPLYPAIAWLNRTAGPVTVYVVHGEEMVDYVRGTLIGDFNGPGSFARMESRVRDSGSMSAALDNVGASYLLVPEQGDSWSWSAWASRDPRLVRVYGDRNATLYRRTSDAGNKSRSDRTTDR